MLCLRIEGPLESAERPLPFGAHRDRAQAMLREYVRFHATRRERTRRNAMMCEEVRLIVDSRVDRERSHKFAVSFDGKICVVRVREQPPSPHNTVSLLAYGSTESCSARLTVTAATLREWEAWQYEE